MERLFGTTDGIEEARFSAKKHSPLVVILIFFLVYLIIGSALQSLVTMIPLESYMVKEFKQEGLFDGIEDIDSPEDIGSIIEKVFETTERIMSNMPSWLTALMLYATIGATVACMFYCVKLEKRRLFTMGFVKKGFIKEYLLGILVGLFIFTAAVAILVIFGVARISFDASAISWPMIILFFFGYVFQGLSEEVACRGYLLVSVAHNSNVTAGVFVSSLMFAALHLGNAGISILAFVNLFLFGFFAALYFLRRGSIWGIAAVHTVWNFTQGNVFGISVSGMAQSDSILHTTISGIKSDVLTGGKFGAEGSLAVTIVLIAGIAVLMLMKPKRTVAF